uniref:Uncharacterized protein n=1 Tax=Peronospora matthiolae TaxID=2874970 RepID=A0AAV1T827_9STRA
MARAVRSCDECESGAMQSGKTPFKVQASESNYCQCISSCHSRTGLLVFNQMCIGENVDVHYHEELTTFF